MTHISQGNSVAGECQFGFPSRYVGSSLLTFDDLLESFGFKTFEFGGSQLQNKSSIKTGRLLLVCSVFSCLVSFTFFFLGDAPDLWN